MVQLWIIKLGADWAATEQMEIGRTCQWNEFYDDNNWYVRDSLYLLNHKVIL